MAPGKRIDIGFEVSALDFGNKADSFSDYLAVVFERRKYVRAICSPG